VAGGRGYGVAPGVRLVSLRALDTHGCARASDLAAALHYAVAIELRLVNASWSVPQASVCLENAIDAAEGSGVLLVAAAGNQDCDLDAGKCSYSSYPIAFGRSNILPVGGVTPNGRPAPYTRGCRALDVAAPATRVQVAVISAGPPPTSTWDVNSGNGTSIAAAFVTGVAALVLEGESKLPPQELRQRIRETAARDSVLCNENSSAGVVDADAAVSKTTTTAPSCIPPC
jgi:subtilisin family serine protease